MPKQEYGIQAGNARFKFVELVNTANGVYVVFPIPEMRMHLSLHYPNKDHPNFGAFLRVPGVRKSYTLELDEKIFSMNHLLKMFDSLGTIVENGYIRSLDDSEVLVLPQSMIDGFTNTGRKRYFDISTLLSPDWRIVEADKLPEMVSKDTPTVMGASFTRKNTAIMYDRKYGAFQLSMDDLVQTLKFDLFGDSFKRSVSDALEEIRVKRPDVLEKTTPIDFIEEIKRLLEKGALIT